MNEKICKNCTYFWSYRVIYEDELEPDDCGWCKCPDADKYMEHTNEENTCCHCKLKGVTNELG